MSYPCERIVCVICTLWLCGPSEPTVCSYQRWSYSVIKLHIIMAFHVWLWMAALPLTASIQWTCTLLPYHSCAGLNPRARSLSRWMDQVETAGWHHLALSRLPRYQAGVEPSLSQRPWRGCSVENRRWSLTAKRQLAGELLWVGHMHYRSMKESKCVFCSEF